MTRLQIEAEGTTRAGPDAVWPLVADATRYAEWGPWDASGYEPSAGGSGGSGHGADGPGHGVGAVRRIRFRRTTTIERVLEVDEGRRIVYTVVRGIPVRNYRGEVVLTPTPEGTHVRWSGTGDRTLLARVVFRKLRSLFPEIVADLVAAADRASSPS